MDHAVAPAIEFDVNTPTARVFKYKKPGDDQAFGKHVTRLARTDRMIANLQVLREGGENNLHSHSHLDGFWMVLGGRARFYGDKNVLIADLGPMEGVLIPRNFKYWFEAVGGETLELLQVESFDISLGDDKSLFKDRTDFTPKTAALSNIKVTDGRIDSPEFGKLRHVDLVSRDLG